MESSASTPEDSIRIAILEADLLGADAARMRLDKLPPDAISPELSADIATLRAIYAAGREHVEARAQEQLIARHGFFGQVALTYGLDRKTEPRRSIEQSSIRTMLLLGGLGLAFVGLVVLSLVLFIAGVVLATKGKIRPAFVAAPSTNPAFLEAFALYLALFVLLGLSGRMLHVTNLNWNWLAVLILPAAAFWVRRRGITFEAWRSAVGWHRGRGWLQEVAAGVGGYLAGLIVVAAGLLVTAALVKWTGASPQHPITQMLMGDGWHVLTLYGLACVFAPIVEETMFRGALFYYLRSRWRWLLSAPIVAGLFAIVHPQGWVALPALGAIALVLAALREWRGSIIAPMAAHALNNFVALTIALLVLR